MYFSLALLVCLSCRHCKNNEIPTVFHCFCYVAFFVQSDSVLFFFIFSYLFVASFLYLIFAGKQAPKSINNSSQIVSKWSQKSIPKGVEKMIRKNYKNASKKLPKEFQNRPQRRPKSEEKGAKNAFGYQLALGTCFGPFWDRFWNSFGSFLEAFL
jgi:hypothetical protein